MLAPLRLLRKARSHLRLLRQDPEQFAANLLQFSNPARYHDKLLDLQTAPILDLRLEASLQARPALNVLQPVLAPGVMSGGPNTVVNLALWLAHAGVPVRIVTARALTEADQAWFWQHLASLTGLAQRPPGLSLLSAHAGASAAIGPRDMFLATHWTTVQQVRAQLPQMEVQPFFYLIQDYEPGFYAWSSNYALALETYGLDHIGVFNERSLFDYFVAQGTGRYADAAFAARALVFEPAVDRVHFHPAPATRAPAQRRLLFYARVGNPRNLLGLGLAALRAAVSDPVFAQGGWEFWAIGGNHSLPPIALGCGRTLHSAPWVNYQGYGELLRSADILLCPMLSPHTSYPVLEMAACGGTVVTNSFGTKTAERLRGISPLILGAPATEAGLAQALVEAARRVTQGTPPPVPLQLPASWRAALADTATCMAQRFHQLVQAPGTAAGQLPRMNAGGQFGVSPSRAS